MQRHKMILSSEKFYTLFANFYRDYSHNRRDYISAVNRFIYTEVSSPKSMIDIGSGDGIRGKDIGDSLGVKRITLVDNSDGMIALAKKVQGSDVILADISDQNFQIDIKYDLVTVLWNVLGHVPLENRTTALINISKLINDGGSIFIDVNNRYNVSHYGIIAVLMNIFKDIFQPSKLNGDFTCKILTPIGEIGTIGHIFNLFEIEKLFKTADLKIEKRKIINYRSGKICKTFLGGQLVYKLSKS